MLEPVGFARPKPLVVLAFLALEGPTTRARLCDLFFAAAVDPLDSLSTTLRRLKRLPGVISVDGSEVSTSVVCDAGEILELLDRGEHARACRAYVGRFLGDVAFQLPVEGEEWMFAEREYLAGRVVDAHLRLGEKSLRDGDDDLARQHAASAYRLAQAENPEGTILARLHHLMLRSGHGKAAQVAEFARRGGGQTTSITVLNRADGGRLGPARPTQLVSRESELEAVVRAVISTESRLVTVHGPGGIGKTRLAQEVIRSIPVELLFGADRYFVALEGVTTPDMTPSAIAQVVGLSTKPPTDTWQGLARAIGESRRLLVIDAWEHLRDSSHRLAELLERCANLQLLVTSRERLSLPQEWALTLKGLAVPGVNDLEFGGTFASLRMFVQQARRLDLAFELPKAEIGAAIRICQAVDGLPLGLALAATWTRGVALGELADTLEQDVIALGHTSADAAPRHANIERVVESSWVALDDRQREILRRLSVCRGFRRDAAADIAGASFSDLVGLMDRSWLGVTPQGRFEQHAVLRRYAELKLEADPATADEAMAAHCQHYRVFLLERLTAGHHTAPTRLADLLVEEGNIAASLENASARGDLESLAMLIEPSQWYFSALGRFRDGDALFAHALAHIDEEDASFNEVIGALYAGRARFCHSAGDVEEAIAYGRRAAELAGVRAPA